jgi:hypothetical protein
MKTEIVKIKITRANGESTCWYNEHVGETFLAIKCDAESGEEVYEGFEMYRILDTEPIVAEIGIGPLYACKEIISDYSEYEVIENPKKYTIEDLREAFKQSRQCKIFEKDMPPIYEEFEDWFNVFNK